MAGEPDGTLVDWRDIATQHRWDTLLLGNGMSINMGNPGLSIAKGPRIRHLDLLATIICADPTLAVGGYGMPRVNQ
jgi:hypothetical protein